MLHLQLLHPANLTRFSETPAIEPGHDRETGNIDCDSSDIDREGFGIDRDFDIYECDFQIYEDEFRLADEEAKISNKFSFFFAYHKQ
ncbi:MAG: hypothetical protein ACJAU0_001871 [Flavobacteriales bacterium]